MKKLIVLTLVLSLVKSSLATGYSGVNNELLIIYAIIIGLCVMPVLILNLYIKLKKKRNVHPEIESPQS